MAVRTGGAGAGGLSLLVVPLKGHPGVTMHRIKTTGDAASGTTFIDLDDVEVPADNLIGQEGQGMRYIMVRLLSTARMTKCLTVWRDANSKVPSTVLPAALAMTLLTKLLIKRLQPRKNEYFNRP